MAIYIFSPTSTEQFVDWNDASVWAGGVVPDNPDADVVFPEITAIATGSPYAFFVSVSEAESFTVNSVSVTYNYLSIYGTLSVAGDLALAQGGEIDMDGGVLSFGTLENGGNDIQGDGVITGSGLLSNETEIIGSGLILNLASLHNTGLLQAASGNLTINVQSGGFVNLVGTSLVGGTYAAGYSNNSVENSNTLYLNVGNVITTDMASIILYPGGRIESYDNANQQYISIQDSLNSVAPSGLLTLYGQPQNAEMYSFGNITIYGTVNLVNATLTSTNLIVAEQGQVTGEGILGGRIIDNGSITAASELDITGSVTGISALQVGQALWGEGPKDHVASFVDGQFSEAGTLELGGMVSDNVEFLGDLGTLIIDNANDFTGAIATDGAGDTIQLNGISLSSVEGYSYAGNSVDGALTINSSTGIYNINFLGNFDTSNFTLSAGPQALSTTPPSLLIRNSGTPTIEFTYYDYTQLGYRSQTISGTVDSADAGRPVSLYDGTTLLSTVATAADGTWTATVSLTPALGTHDVTARVTNAAGNTGISDPIVYTVIAPLVTITNASELPDSLTQTLTGTIDAADAGLTISIYDGATLLGTTTANGAGAWIATVSLSDSDPNVLTAQATNSADIIGLSNALAFAVGGGATVDFASGTGNAASLYNTSGGSDLVNGDDVVVYLTDANASVVGNDDTIYFAGGTGNLVSLFGAGVDMVYGSNETVELYGAQASVTGGGDAIYFAGGTGNAVSLYGAAGSGDAVYGSSGTVYLSNAQASVVGGDDTIYFSGGSGNAANLYDTGSAADTLYGSSGTVYLSDAQASVIGGDDTVYFWGGSGNAANLFDTGGAADTLYGSTGTVYLTSAQAAVVGGNDAIYLSGGSGNMASLFDTGGLWDAVYGSNGSVAFTSAQGAVVGGGDMIYFSGGSGNAAALFDTGGVWDTVYGSNGSVALNSAQGSVVGGDDTIYLSGGLGNAANLYDTGGVWDTVYGSNGSVSLTYAEATVVGNGNAISLYGTNWLSTIGGSEAFVFQPSIGQDTINGFAASDSMQFSASDFANFAALSPHISQSGSSTLISLDANDTVTLTNTLATSLTSSQFHFV